jgi:AraC-like DNA-binding protein
MSPPDQDFTLPVHYIRLMAELLAGMGQDSHAWLAHGGLNAEDLQDPARGVSFDVLCKLVSEALRMTDDPAFGLLVGERLRINTHGMLGYAALASGTLRQAIELVERYIAVRTTLVTVSHEVRGREVLLRFTPARPLGDIERPVLESIVLTVKNLTDHITLGHGHVLRAHFAFARPDYAALAEDMFKCEVKYGQRWTGYVLPLDAIDQPLSTADPASFEEAARICQRELDKRARHTPLSARVRRILLGSQVSFPSLQVTARMFNLTPRTLHRHLQDEGTSFKAILEEVRHMLALEHLKAGRLSIQEIAFTLGYTDQANFRRAFKRWEGIPPSDWQGQSR